MRVMSAGDGYKYLLRSVVAGDGDRSLSTPLTRYYAEVGNPPGSWLGSGLAQLGEGRITPGEEVSEQQLQLLIGMGCDPVTGDPLGRAYPVYKTPAERIAERVEALDADLGPASRAEAIAEIEAEEHGRGTRKAVAGYDYTFSLPKSASVLWAVADAGTQALIAEAHHAAIAEVIDFMEREVAATRVGMTGADGGAVAQVDTFGLAATAYDHYDSRSSDPHLHTHVVVSNKVKTTLDGRWRSLDGRPMHAATVALSELHEAIIADHLTRLLGVEWEARDRGRDRNPAWAISTVPEELVLEFSTRARQIDAEKDRLIAEYVEKHGRQPSAAAIIKLRAQATLSTRPEKQVRSLADLTTEWRKRATALLGRDASEWVREAIPAAPARVLRADDLPLDEIEKIGRAVMEAVGEKRSTWHRWNLTAEAARQTMEYRFATTRDREAVSGMVVDAAEHASLRLTPPELASTPARFQRPDGSSAFRPRHGILYSSEALLDAEKRLLERSRTLTGPELPLALIEKVTRRPDREGRMLGSDQADALTRIAVSGCQLDLLVGPAGTGKTTAMLALRTAWEQQHGTGSVVGLAPSAVAAEVLAGDLGIKTENTARWWTLHIMTGSTFQTGQLVIVDEASLAGTLALDRITGAAAKAGAKILLVGDYGQLQSPAAAGAFGLLAGDRPDTPELSTIHRFTHEWEKTASLRLRLGEPDVIDVYQDADRIIGGTTDDMTARAYEAWRADREAGIESILVSDSGEAVAALNLRARTELILADVVNPLRGEVTLNGGVQAAAGDTVITRKNERKLRTRFSWVQNGNRWTITKVRPDGSVTVRPAGPGRGESIAPRRLRRPAPRPRLRSHRLPRPRRHDRHCARTGRTDLDQRDLLRRDDPRTALEPRLRGSRPRRRPCAAAPRRRSACYGAKRVVRRSAAQRGRTLGARDHRGRTGTVGLHRSTRRRVRDHRRRSSTRPLGHHRPGLRAHRGPGRERHRVRGVWPAYGRTAPRRSQPPQRRYAPAPPRRRARVQRRRRHRRRPSLPGGACDSASRRLRQDSQATATHRRPPCTGAWSHRRRDASSARRARGADRGTRRRRTRRRADRERAVDEGPWSAAERPTTSGDLAQGRPRSRRLPRPLPHHRRRTARSPARVGRTEDRRRKGARRARPSASGR